MDDNERGNKSNEDKSHETKMENNIETKGPTGFHVGVTGQIASIQVRTTFENNGD